MNYLPTIGIYKITNLINNKVYIGQSIYFLGGMQKKPDGAAVHISRTRSINMELIISSSKLLKNAPSKI
jgi:hypothetical protein